jgi:hypothetical protein
MTEKSPATRATLTLARMPWIKFADLSPFRTIEGAAAQS